ncbi:DUF1444 family protein [Verminephrobacter aporrectodeae subsp. tuberculatae]|uniref:DUF1444 family protein n=1 Tax=Verminephrobacter aporrectodeae TaxID=1110389 RepID=UPI00224464C3|nr:DUF1444 family protein [Verminephrobacter aporrectodeae]MCW8166514.1 DUF1444 family protein [Verminephrobacter aporrectodeae subsp. tuberculatae]MCW8170663.1 DUF1444 family protein [Verminephrobacter aporrectodeae subsp. tuberculatae]MCW8207137.1 DUF1444 family protein [Verminephrobacter aporrectodeae subsp. tuberculatae]
MINSLFNLFKKALRTEPPKQVSLREQLVPRIRHVSFLKMLQEHGVPEQQQPVTTALCGELLVSYAFDLPDQFIMASPSQLEQAGVAVSEVPALALWNLARLMPRTEHFDKQGCMVVRTGGELEATLLLLDTFMEYMHVNSLGKEIVAAVPRRDCLLLCDARNAGALAELGSLAEKIFTEAQDAHALSAQKMLRRDGRWELFTGH